MKRSRTVRRGYQALLLGAALAAAPGTAQEPAPLRTATVSELKAALKPKGRPLLVHLWATWCKPCVAEMPALAAGLRRIAAGPVDVLLVALDEPKSAARAAALLAEAGGVPGTSLLAPVPRVYSAMDRVDGEWEGKVPTTLLLDARGKLVHAQRGSTALEPLSKEVEKATNPGP